MEKLDVRGALLAAILSAAAPAFAGTTDAPGRETQPRQAGGTLAIGYTIAFWGIPFGHTNYAGRFSPGGYSATSHFETSGIVSLFWQARIDASADGRLGARALVPLTYDSFYRRGAEKKERVKVTFANGDATTFADPPYNTTRYPVTAEQKRQAVDPMSAVTLVVAGLKADAAHPCGTVAPVFDGRRRYDIEFTYLKDEHVKLDHGLFDGNAHLCRLHYRQIAGFKPKILKEGAAFPPMFGDFADIPSAAAPQGHFVAALKLWAHLSWGTVSAELTQLRLGGDHGDER